MKGDRSNLEAARLYFNWHAAHINPDSTIFDYTGTYPNYSSTGDYDSTDSYGALFLMALWQYYVATGDADFVAGKWAAIGKCSQDTANRDIAALLDLGLLRKGDGGGRSTHYELVL